MSLFVDVAITADSIVKAAWARATANRERMRRRMDVQAVREGAGQKGGKDDFWETVYTTPTPSLYKPDEPVAYPSSDDFPGNVAFGYIGEGVSQHYAYPHQGGEPASVAFNRIDPTPTPGSFEVLHPRDEYLASQATLNDPQELTTFYPTQTFNQRSQLVLPVSKTSLIYCYWNREYKREARTRTAPLIYGVSTVSDYFSFYPLPPGAVMQPGPEGPLKWFWPAISELEDLGEEVVTNAYCFLVTPTAAKAIPMPGVLNGLIANMHPPLSFVPGPVSIVIPPLLVSQSFTWGSYVMTDPLGNNPLAQSAIRLSTFGPHGDPAVFKALRDFNAYAAATDPEDFFSSLRPPVSGFGQCALPDTCTAERIGFDYSRAFLADPRVYTRYEKADKAVRANPGDLSLSFDIAAWDWGKASYCRSQLLALGFTTADLTP